jgi:hypothetical protein
LDNFLKIENSQTFGAKNNHKNYIFIKLEIDSNIQKNRNKMVQINPRHVPYKFGQTIEIKKKVKEVKKLTLLIMVIIINKKFLKLKI